MINIHKQKYGGVKKMTGEEYTSLKIKKEILTNSVRKHPFNLQIFLEEC